MPWPRGLHLVPCHRIEERADPLDRLVPAAIAAEAFQKAGDRLLHRRDAVVLRDQTRKPQPVRLGISLDHDQRHHSARTEGVDRQGEHHRRVHAPADSHHGPLPAQDLLNLPTKGTDDAIGLGRGVDVKCFSCEFADHVVQATLSRRRGPRSVVLTS